VLRSVLRAAIIAGLIAAVGIVVAQRQLGRPDPVVTPSPLATKWRYATEQEWIVAHVTAAIVDMTHYARSGAAPDAAALDVKIETDAAAGSAASFTAHIPGRKTVRLTATPYIWAPTMYSALAADLLGPSAAAAPPPEPPRESSSFAALLRPRTDVMAAESRRISSALSTRMTDAAAHEDAALLYAVLGLREWAGQYYDNHRTLCRLAAHLAMADALRRGADPGPSARVAEATLQTLAFRDQRGVLRQLEALEAQPKATPALRSWTRTLRMRNTEDWRLLPVPQKASLLERREYFVWVNSKLGHGRALEFLDETDRDGLSDWGSILLSVQYGVEAGNRFVPAGLAEVLNEASEMPLEIADREDPAAFVRAFNEEPAPGPVRLKQGQTVVEVIDSGTWADFAQRHVLHHVESGVDHMRRMLGLREGADEYQAQMVRTFGELRQFPLAAARMARTRAAYAAAMPRALELLAAGPEWVGGHNWNMLLRPPHFPADAFGVPPMESWYRPLFPTGTFFEWPKRVWMPNRHLRVRGPMLQQMHEELPYYGLVAEAAAFDRYGPKPTAAQLKNAYAPLLDYDVRLLGFVAEASRDDPAEYERLYRRIGDLDPDRLSTLGYYLMEKGKKEAAAEVFEQYATEARGRVGVCNSMGWLVEYYEDQGNKAQALARAKQAAEVYCSRGLLTLAKLYEGRKQWASAEEYYRKQTERYGDEYFLLGFYLRHQRTTGDDERFRAPREELMAKIFPKGLEPMSSDPSGPPPDGVVLTETSDGARKAALSEGDVIVALDGFRVRTYEQYMVIWGLGEAPTTREDPDVNQLPKLNLVVWRGVYRHVLAGPPHRFVGVWVRSFNGPEDPERKSL
jgi:hypothetical protein